jgi:hypothetical protein
MINTYMRAVKGKNNQLSFINKFETDLYNLAETLGSVNATDLSERDAHIAEEMYQKNIFNKEVKDGRILYKIFPPKQKL